MAQTVKNPPAMQETWVQSLGQEDPLEKRMATHSSILARRIPWTEEPGGLQSLGLLSWIDRSKLSVQACTHKSMWGEVRKEGKHFPLGDLANSRGQRVVGRLHSHILILLSMCF